MAAFLATGAAAFPAFFAAAAAAPKTGFLNVTDLTVSRFRATLAEMGVASGTP